MLNHLESLMNQIETQNGASGPLKNSYRVIKKFLKNVRVIKKFLKNVRVIKKFLKNVRVIKKFSKKNPKKLLPD
jgi:hypothetical protein